MNYGKVSMSVVRTTYLIDEEGVILKAFGKVKAEENPAQMLAELQNNKIFTPLFPMHPHRGIEMISYVYYGYMTHKDSLGNEDTIGDGEVQWRTAGSGILHEEKLLAADRLLGVQLWLNLPAKDKRVPPVYHSIKNLTL